MICVRQNNKPHHAHTALGSAPSQLGQWCLSSVAITPDGTPLSWRWLNCLWEIVINSLFSYALLVHVPFAFPIELPLSQSTSVSTFTFPTVFPIKLSESGQ